MNRVHPFARGCLLAAAVALLLAGVVSSARPATVHAAVQTAPGQVTARSEERLAWLVRLRSWVRAVFEHAPGTADSPAVHIGSWSDDERDTMRTDLVWLLKRTRQDRDAQRQYDYKQTTFTLAELRAWLGLDGANLETGNLLLERGALLHADIAMLVVPIGLSAQGCRATEAVTAKDGLIVGSGCEDIHWSFARALLDHLTPSPSRSATARLWSLATTAWMLEGRDYTDAGPHVEHIQRWFPTDADILFEHGRYHEALAAPGVQVIARDVSLNLPSARRQLTEAAELFRLALVSNPDLAEARVRRGRVLHALGQDQEASHELRRATAGLLNVQLRYYAELFLGDAHAALGQYAPARDCYARAATLYPGAQSPRLALSLLARRTGGRVAALHELETILARPPDEWTYADPWWTYHVWQLRPARDLLAELRKPFLPVPPR
jgi:tetratricopeptide (TPR) repeat protein